VKQYFQYCIWKHAGTQKKHATAVVGEWDAGLCHLLNKQHPCESGHGCSRAFGTIHITSPAAVAQLTAFWNRWRSDILAYRYYFNWSTNPIDSFCRELLVYRDKIVYWRRFIAMRHKLAILRHNMQDGFLDWLCS
jgi:hypothetical protein